MAVNFEYFYGRELEQFSFIRIPKLLFTDKTFSGLSNDAKLLYSLMLDRMSLSKQNGWLDESGRVYIIFTVEEAAEVLNCGTEKVTRLFGELDDSKGIGLITRRRRGLGKPSVIYLHKFTYGENTDNNNIENPVSIDSTSENQESGKSEVRTADNTVSGNSIIENQENGIPKFSNADNPYSVNRNSEILDCGKSKCNNTDFNQTDFKDTDFNQSSSARENAEKTDDEEIISSVNRNIDFEALCRKYDSSIVTGMRDIIADVIRGKHPVKVSGKLIEEETASEMFSKLGHRNAVNVLDSMARTQIHSPSSWIPAALYNSIFNGTDSSAVVRKETEPSFDLDRIMEHARNTPLKVRSAK